VRRQLGELRVLGLLAFARADAPRVVRRIPSFDPRAIRAPLPTETPSFHPLSGAPMSRVIAFADNQVIVAADGGTTTIYTDPVPLGDDDRGTAQFQVEYIFNSATPHLVYLAQVSLDGTNWVDTALTDDASAAGVSALTEELHGAFVRFKFSLTAASSVVAAACFDLHVLLDHV
jgi:hypothetical protein